MLHVNACAAAGVGAVVGTTGLSEADRKALAEAGRTIPLVYAPNMSVGVNVLLKLVALAAQRLGDDYDVEIVEMHHRHKVDAPSGTALQLGEAVAAALGRDLKTDGVFARDGMIGERKPGVDRLRELARRRRRRRSHGDIRRARRAHRARAQGLVAHDVRAGGAARRTLCRGAPRRERAGSVRHAGRPRARLTASCPRRILSI